MLSALTLISSTKLPAVAAVHILHFIPVPRQERSSSPLSEPSKSRGRPCWRYLPLDVRGSLRGTPSLIGPSSHSQKHEVSMATKILWLAFADSRTNKPHSSRRWSPAPLSPILVSTCSKRWALWANGSTQRGTKTNPIFRRRRRRFGASKARVR
jgi:hypothetical protein